MTTDRKFTAHESSITVACYVCKATEWDRMRSVGIMSVPSEVFSDIGDSIFARAHGMSRTVRQRRFKALFGITPPTCASAWAIISRSVPRGTKPVHLMWTALFLKVYAAEYINSALTGVDCKTFRKWMWSVLQVLSAQNLVRKLTFVFHWTRLTGVWRQIGIIGWLDLFHQTVILAWMELILWFRNQPLSIPASTRINSKGLDYGTRLHWAYKVEKSFGLLGLILAARSTI